MRGRASKNRVHPRPNGAKGCGRGWSAAEPVDSGVITHSTPKVVVDGGDLRDTQRSVRRQCVFDKRRRPSAGIATILLFRLPGVRHRLRGATDESRYPGVSLTRLRARALNRLATAILPLRGEEEPRGTGAGLLCDSLSLQIVKSCRLLDRLLTPHLTFLLGERSVRIESIIPSQQSKYE